MWKLCHSTTTYFLRFFSSGFWGAGLQRTHLWHKASMLCSFNWHLSIKYSLTSMTRPYYGIMFRAHRGHLLFFKLTAVQVQVFDCIRGPSQIKLLQPGALLLGLATSIYPVLADSQLPLKNIYQTYQIIRYSPIFCITKIIWKLGNIFFKKDKITIFILEPALLHFIFLVQCESFRCCLFQQFRWLHPVMVSKDRKHVQNDKILVQFSSVYLFAIENYMNRSKKKSNYLDSHGEEAQKKLAGL